MRVLLWSDAFYPHVGGVEVLGAHFVAGLRERGHEVLVITDLDDPEMEPRGEVGGVEVARVEVRRAIERRDMRALTRARAEVGEMRRAFAPEIDHLFHPGPVLMVAAAVRAAESTPSVFTLHLTPTPELLGAGSLYGRELRGADWVTACSRSTLEEVEEETGKLEHASVIVNALPPAAGDEPAPAAAGAPLLFIGRLSRQKGFDLGLAMLAKLRGSRPGLQAIIAGDGAEAGALHDRAAELGLGDAVEFTGWVAPADVPALMARSSIVVMPSRFEPYGLVALEAAQQARPLVGFAVDGLVEAVATGAGSLVPPGDVDALAAAVAELLDDPELARKVGQTARAQAVSPAPWEAHLDRYEELFRRLRRGLLTF